MSSFAAQSVSSLETCSLEWQAAWAVAPKPAVFSSSLLHSKQTKKNSAKYKNTNRLSHLLIDLVPINTCSCLQQKYLRGIIAIATLLVLSYIFIPYQKCQE